MSTDAGNIPREPPAYRPSNHFLTRLRDLGDDRSRHLDGDIVEGCIKRGTPTYQGDGRYALRETFDGVTYDLVVHPGNGRVLTGYPIGINTEAANASDRWTEEQIEDILEFIRTDPR